MEFKFYIKTKSNKYELREIVTNNITRDFLNSLLKSIDNELENIRDDLKSIDGISLSQPSHKDKEINKKIEKLVQIRKVNLDAKVFVKESLSENEFIICEKCGGKMFKVPINVSYKKIGKNYIINANELNNIQYNFNCENCNFSEREIHYYQKQEWKKRREDLLQKGYNFVPNDFGIWHYLDNGNPLKKSPEMEDNDPEYTFKRITEEKEINGEKVFYVYDVCYETGKKFLRWKR